METLPISLEDLVPKESTFTLSTLPGKSFTLCRWSLRVRAWAIARYTSEGLKEIFDKQKIDEIAQMTWFMLKEKDAFPAGLDGEGGFLDNISSPRDQIGIITALLGSVGIGEPEIKKINDLVKSSKADPKDPKPKAPKKKIGAKSSTP